jgi:hypothetical protein
MDSASNKQRVANGTAILSQLLALHENRARSWSCDLLYRILAASPSPAVLTGRKNIFNVLEVAEQETAHSYFLAWLLDRHGPLTANWLLRALFEVAAPGRPWPGVPERVEAEVEMGCERPDIVAFWSEFTLVIEYKIDSPETSNQVSRYLRSFDIVSVDKGALLYVTKHGLSPASVTQADPRVTPLSYEEIIGLIDTGLESEAEPSERGRVLAREFRNCMAQAMKRSFTLDKPTFSDSTKLMFERHKDFKALRDVALEESSEFVHWISREAAKRLGQVLGNDMVWHDTWEVKTQTEFIYRRPRWALAGVEFGIGFGTENLSDRLLPEVDMWFGVILPWPDKDENEPVRKSLSTALRGKLENKWPLRGAHASDIEWPVYQSVKFSGAEGGSDPYTWAEKFLGNLVELATAYAPHLDEFVTSAPL